MSAGKRAFNVLLIFSFIWVIFALISVFSAYRFYSTSQVLFTMVDPADDDYGPGTYIYPTGVVFDPGKDLFDLLKFTSAALGDSYTFDINFAKVTNPLGGAAGFSHQMIQIYLSEGYTEGGATETLRQGANISFDSQNPWKTMIKVVGMGKTAVFYNTDPSDFEGRTEGIITRLLADKKTIRVTVPKNLLPGDPHRWKYYVLVGVLDGAGPDNFNVVHEQPDKWNFGGGTSNGFNPNVIDMLAVEGKQEKMLGAYNEGEKYAVIEPVRPQLIENSLWERYLIKIIKGVNNVRSIFN